jgi:hypothetical protein
MRTRWWPDDVLLGGYGNHVVLFGTDDEASGNAHENRLQWELGGFGADLLMSDETDDAPVANQLEMLRAIDSLFAAIATQDSDLTSSELGVGGFPGNLDVLPQQ